MSTHGTVWPLGARWQGALALLAAAALTPCAVPQRCEPGWSDRFFPSEFSPADASVRAVATFDDGSGNGPALYVAGTFEGIAGIPLNGIARWLSRRWHALAAGLDGDVYALAVFDDGAGPALYAGGDFDHAGRMPAAGIARWDGSTWSPLGRGLKGTVRALAVFDDGNGQALYAGGDFDGVAEPVQHVARWDGRIWSAPGAGTDGPVLALSVCDLGAGAALYAGGEFLIAGDVDASHVARWDGRRWSALGAGVDAAVEALASFDDGTGESLYAGGSFMSASGATASRIARWDGMAWSPLGDGLPDSVHALVVHDDGEGPSLFVGGSFHGDLYHLARWNGSWSTVGEGVSGIVYALGVQWTGTDDESLIVGGSFSHASNVRTRNIARWHGQEWGFFDMGVGGVTYPHVHALLAVERGFDDKPALYIGGRFRHAGGASADCIVSWDGATWRPLGAGIGGNNSRSVRTLALLDDGLGPALYAGGYFETAGGVATGCIARWDGKAWSALGGEIDGAVDALAVFDDGAGPAVYAGGWFYAPDVGGTSLAWWNGSSWSRPPEIPDGNVGAMCVFDDGTGPALYVAGGFQAVGDLHARNIARWDGLQWSSVGGGLEGDGYYEVVQDLLVYDEGRGPALYAAGAFRTAGVTPARNVARWDGARWSTVGGGTNGPIAALAVLDGPGRDGPVLFAAGDFDLAGGAECRHVARWNGTFWSALDLGIHSAQDYLTYIDDMLVFDDGSDVGPALLVGGLFATAGSVASQNIALWTDCPVENLPPFNRCGYDIAVVPVLDRNSPGSVDDINAAGEVVGQEQATLRPFRYSLAGGMTYLPCPTDNPQGAASAIDDEGQVAGGATSGHGWRAAMWDATGIHLFDHLPGETDSAVAAISGSRAAGWVQTDTAYHAVIWVDGVPRDLGPDLRTPWSTAEGVNRRGQVAGSMGGYGHGAQLPRAFIWQDGAVTDLGVLPGGFEAQAMAINDRGQVVGWDRVLLADEGMEVYRPFIWSGGRMADLGTPPGFRSGGARDINDAGDVVGWASDDSRSIAVLWRDGAMIDLNDLIAWDAGLVVHKAAAINDAGQIAAYGRLDGDSVLLILSPIDAPVGDVDGDCEIDDVDLVLLLFERGPGPSPADFNGDGSVGIGDLLLLLANWMDP